jgi:hypothetical protein
MPEAFEEKFVATADKPALIACTQSAVNLAAQKALRGLKYKVHTVSDHDNFTVSFSQTRYHVVVMEELFACEKLEENLSLRALQNMPVDERRHATIILLGEAFITFDAMQAFRKSVHAVVNISEIALLKPLVERAVTDNDAFLHNYREVQTYVARF